MSDYSGELDVFLNEVRSGRLTETGSGLMFRYFPEYLRLPAAYPLSVNLPLREEEFATPDVEYFFSNLLPDERMRRAVAAVLGTAPENTFGLLKRIGADCAGAVSFYVPGETPHSLQEPVFRELSEPEAYALLDNLDVRPLAVGEDGVRISGAGSQAKLAACVHGGTVALPLYGTPSTHIIKPAVPGIADSVYNELFCMKLAERCRVPAAACSLLHLQGGDFYVVKRFDRQAENGVVRRLHQEDFCQLLNVPPQRKYQEDGGPGIEESLARMRELHLPAGDCLQFLRLVIFNFLIGNCDAHAKNFSVLYRGGKPGLAPAYDLLSTMIYDHMSKCQAMKIGGENRMGQLTRRHFADLAERCELRPALVLGELDKLAGQLPAKAAALAAELNLQYPDAVYGRIAWMIGRLCRQVAD